MFLARLKRSWRALNDVQTILWLSSLLGDSWTRALIASAMSLLYAALEGLSGAPARIIVLRAVEVSVVCWFLLWIASWILAKWRMRMRLPPSKEFQIAQDLEALRLAHDTRRDIAELRDLLKEGMALHQFLIRRGPETRRMPTGPTGPATVPVVPYNGFEGDEWSGRVWAKLKTMRPDEMERHFMSCSENEQPARLGCYIVRLQEILTALWRRES